MLGTDGAKLPGSPKPNLKQETPAKDTTLIGEEELGESANAIEKADARKKRLEDLDALLWNNALGDTEEGSDNSGRQQDGEKRHRKIRAKHHVRATVHGIEKGAGLTPLKMGAGRQEE